VPLGDGYTTIHLPHFINIIMTDLAFEATRHHQNIYEKHTESPPESGHLNFDFALTDA
jgi:hypothetical protein